MSKWMDKLTRQFDKYNPRKRKQYRKSRYRKQAKRFEDFCKREEEKAEEFERLHPNWLAEVNEMYGL